MAWDVRLAAFQPEQSIALSGGIPASPALPLVLALVLPWLSPREVGAVAANGAESGSPLSIHRAAVRLAAAGRGLASILLAFGKKRDT